MPYKIQVRELRPLTLRSKVMGKGHINVMNVAIHPPPKDTPMCQIRYAYLKEQSYDDPDTNQHRPGLLYIPPPPNLFAGGIKRNF